MAFAGPSITPIKDVTLVNEQFNEQTSTYSAKLHLPTGIGRFHLRVPASIQTVVLVIQRQKYCEGLSFTQAGDDKKSFDLRSQAGVNVNMGDDTTITLSAEVFATLGFEGEVQYINQYR